MDFSAINITWLFLPVTTFNPIYCKVVGLFNPLSQSASLLKLIKMGSNSSTFAQPSHFVTLSPPTVFHTPHCPFVASFTVFMSLFCAQTGFIRVGEESMFIEPLDENDPLQSFSGLKHRLLRQRRSAKNSSAPENEEPRYCGTVRGKCDGPIHWMTRIGFYQMQIKRYWSLRGRNDAIVHLHPIFDILSLANRINRTKPQ